LIFYGKARTTLKAGFFGLGADLRPGLHDPHMTFDEEVLPDGVKIPKYAVDILLN
jgi:amidohydrolase